MNAEASPALRRCAYGLLALILLMDAIGSMVWGNLLADQVSIFIANFSFLIDSQLTSSIASQVVIAFHFLYVSCRSRDGCGWAYASLRFELDERGKLLKTQALLPIATSGNESGSAECDAAPALGSDQTAPQTPQRNAAAANVFSTIRRRWQLFRQRQVSRCEVFVIPCTAACDDAGGGQAAFALMRPAINLRYLRPLQRLSDTHPKLYLGIAFLSFAVPAIVFTMALSGEARGVANLVCIFFIWIALLGFMSGRRHNVDRVAAKHVLLSFRFAIIAALLATDIAMSIRLMYNGEKHATQVAAYAMIALLVCLSMLIDCSPHLPSAAQISVSVQTHITL
jgi:hypothetical protein